MRSMGWERMASFRLRQRAAGVVRVAPHADGHIVPVRLDGLDPRGVEHMQMSVEFCKQPRPLLGYRTCTALELGEQTRQQGLPLVGAARCMPRPHAVQCLAEPLVIERLQQVVHGGNFECRQGVGVVRGDEDQRWKIFRPKRTRDVDAVHRVHLNVEEQQLGLARADRIQRAGAVAEFADYGEIRLRGAIFPQHAPAGRLVVDDDHLHAAPTSGAARPMSRRSRRSWISGMLISAIHSAPRGPALSEARPSN